MHAVTRVEEYTDGARLLADIGGTNARFALETAPGRIGLVSVLPCADYAMLEDAIRAYLNGAQVKHAALAIASPVEGDAVRMANHHWSFSIAALGEALGLQTLEVVNDFTALAMALPQLDSSQCIKLGGAEPKPGRAIGLLGPGTGLGVSGLIPFEGRWIPLASEGGHATFAPADETEAGLLRMLWRDHEHVSAERLLSGAGLEAIHRGLSGSDAKAADIVARALAGGGDCHASVMAFCAILGSVAGNVALTLGAGGGVYIGGGIVPRFGALLAASPFRERFEAKGRMRGYLAAIPAYLITEEYPAFLGAAALLSARLAGQD